MVRTFVLKNIELEDRLDVAFYNPEYKKLLNEFNSIISKNQNLNLYDLKSILSEDNLAITGGATPLGACYLYDGVPFIRIQNVTELGLDFTDIVFINQRTHNELLKRSKLKNGDVLFTITGSYGISTIVPDSIREANINQHIAKISVDKDKIIPEYLSIFLNTNFGKIQCDRWVSGSTRFALNYLAIKKIKVLYPKNKQVQEQIVKEVSKCYNLSIQAKEKYKSTMQEMRKIPEKMLEIEIPKEGNKHFTIKITDLLLEERIDALIQSPYLKKIWKEIKDSDKSNVKYGRELNIINQRINFEKDKTRIFKYVDIGNTEKDLGLITGYEEDILINLPSRARQVMKNNDILIPRPIGSSEGIVIVPEEFDGQLCSTGFIIIRPTDKKEALLLWAILKSDIIQKQFYFVQSGSLQPEITPKNFKEKVLIPIPKDNIKNEIINKIEEKIDEAQRQKRVYEENLKRAKETFINMLLRTNS